MPTRRRATWWVASLALLASGCGPSIDNPSAVGEDGASAGARVELTGGALDGRGFAVDGCRSGQIFSFYGVDFTSASDPGARLRVVVDPIDGPTAVVGLAGRLAGEECSYCTAGRQPRRLDETTLRLTPQQCATFDLDLQHDNSTVNEIWGLEGRLVLDCTVEATRVTTDLRFDACY